MSGGSLSSRAVDICATILSDTPPKLPLRQEYMSLGFEVVFNAEGVGSKATEHEARRAVEEFRINEAIKEFRKRRFIPKKYKRIKEKLDERKRIEKDLALPHGLTYEAYQAEMNRYDGSSFTSGSKSGSELSDIDFNRKKTSWIRRRNYKKQRRQASKQTSTRFFPSTRQSQQSDVSNGVFFPDLLLAPVHNQSTVIQTHPKQYWQDNNKESATVTTNESESSMKDDAPASNASITTDGSAAQENLRLQFFSSDEQFLPGLMTVQESSDDGTGYTGKNMTQTNSSNRLDASSSDKSELSGLNPFDDGVKFPDLIKSVTSNISQPMSKQQSIVAGGSPDRPNYFNKTDTADNDNITEPANWIGESKKCFNNIAREFCHMVEVEGQPVEGKDANGKSDKTVTSCTFSAFSDLSPELYDTSGMQLPKTWGNAANAGTDLLCPSEQYRHDKSSLLEHNWTALAQNFCGSAAMEIYHAVVIDTPTCDGRRDESTIRLSEQQKQEEEQLSVTAMKSMEGGKGIDPPTSGDNETVDASCIHIVSSQTSQEDAIADFNDGNRANSDLGLTDLASNFNQRFGNIPANVYSNGFFADDIFDPSTIIDSSRVGVAYDKKSVPSRNPGYPNAPRTDDGAPRINAYTAEEKVSSAANGQLNRSDDYDVTKAKLQAKTESLKASMNALNELRRPMVENHSSDVGGQMYPFMTSQTEMSQIQPLPLNQFKPTVVTQSPLMFPSHSLLSQPQSPKQSQIQSQTILPPTLNYNENPQPNIESPTNAWVQSAKTAIQTITSEVYKAAGIDTSNKKEDADTLPQVDSDDKLLAALSRDSLSVPWGQIPAEKLKKADDDIGTLFAALSNKYPPMFEIERILTVSPELVQVRQQPDGRMPLHAVCDRGMPDRSTVNVEALTDNLLRDIASYKRLIKLVVTLFPEACLVQDNKGDLPAHLIARCLMLWEAEWYEKVYLQASKEKGATGKTALAITKLYHNMSESVEMLLRPLASDSVLCKAHGSMGTILPLHIASIFTASVNTIRLILEAYPEAASIPCDLGILQTFIPDESLPLELHDNLSTDFPKWEIEAKQASHPEVRWSQSELEKSQEEDCMRRSDLLFAYNPIEPHRFEKARMRRLEARIQFEAKRAVYDSSAKKLNRATELLWVWMCTFREPDTRSPTYVNSVKRIVASLSMPALRYLVALKTMDHKPILEQANAECLKVIQKRLDSFSLPGAEEDHTDTALADDMTEMTSVNSFEKSDSSMHVAPEFRLQGDRGFVSNLCRLVFNLEEVSYPTSFVILPYKLALKDGKLRMASQDSLVVAAKFAECLLNLTDPRSILHFLDSKASEFYDHPIYDQSANKTLPIETNTRVQGYEEALLALFSSGDAYFYLLDEVTGLPAVLAGESVYPISVQEPQEVVRTLLPLMMMGMVQMRGEKAISKLANVFLDKNVASLAPSWIDASNDLKQFLDDKEITELTLPPDLADLKKALVKFRSKSSRLKSRQLRNGIRSEWDSELRFLDGFLSENDPKQEYLHVRSIKDGGDVELINVNNSSHATSSKKEEDSVNVLAKKLERLSEIHTNVRGNPAQGAAVNNGGASSLVPASVDDEGQMQRKQMISRYSVLFDELAFESPAACSNSVADTEDYSARGVRVWNAAKNVWEDVAYELEQPELVSDNPQITKLKVALAEQARKLAFLGKKVASLRDEEQRVFNNVSEEDISNIIEEASIVASKNDLAEARRLVLRMCDLEERLLHDEIAIQHFAMETNMMEAEKGVLVDYYELRKTEKSSQALMKRTRTSSSLAEEDFETRSQAWTSTTYCSGNFRDDPEKRFESWTQSVPVIHHPQGQSLNFVDLEPHEIVDLADASDVSEAPLTNISFDNRRRPILIQSVESQGYDAVDYAVEAKKQSAWSNWGVSLPPSSYSRGRIPAVDTRSPRFTPSPTSCTVPVHTFDLVDTEFISTKFTLQRKTYSFSSSKSSTEILDVTEMSDVSSYLASPRRLVLPPSSARPLEIVDVTDMSVSHHYSTQSNTRSGYSMAGLPAEVVDLGDISSGGLMELDRRKPYESRYDYHDRRDPFDIREEISPRFSPSPVHINRIRGQSSSSGDYAPSNYRRRQPSASSDELTPSSTIALGLTRRHFEQSSGDEAARSSTTALATNRYNRIQFVDQSPRTAVNRGMTANSRMPPSFDDGGQLSPRVVAIDKVITKYTTPQPGRKNRLYSPSLNGTRKTSYNAF